MAQKSTSGTHVFETAIGPVGIAWTERGIDRLELPREDAAATRDALVSCFADRPLVVRPTGDAGRAVRLLKRHLSGKPAPLEELPLDLSGASPFARRAYAALRRVGPGRVITYGELAAKLGSPGGSRAVGRAMGANPVPIIVPCHRVLAADRQLGGFSAHGGLRLKARLLFDEGVMLDADHAAGVAALRRADPTLRRIIARVGPYLPAVGRPVAAYDALVEAIVHQQISIKAGATIAERLRRLTPGARFPSPIELDSLDDDALRSAGLSGQKVSYLRDLARHAAGGSLSLARLRRLGDDEVIEELTRVRGIGRWSAQMFLIFRLGRLDVLPTDDLGLRNAVREAYGLEEPPDAAALTTRAERWRPYRSMACWYLWQASSAGGI